MEGLLSTGPTPSSFRASKTCSDHRYNSNFALECRSVITCSLLRPHLCLAVQSAGPRFVPVFAPNKSVQKSRVVTVSSNQPRSRRGKSNQDVSLVSLVYGYRPLSFTTFHKGRVQQIKIQNVSFFQKGVGGVDPKVYIFKKSIYSEKRLQNGFL